MCTIFFIKKIEDKAKREYISKLNSKTILPILNTTVMNSASPDIEFVKKILEFREYLSDFKSVKKDIASILTLVTTVLGGGIQILIAVISK
jgi:hypothetical protein